VSSAASVAFITTCRAEISPADIGLPASGRRRTPGLRREEVAQRAGVGLSWDTWLEQGRDVTLSAQVLLALSHALGLSSHEEEHLFVLAGMARPISVSRRSEADVDERTVALVHALEPHVAFVLSPRFDILVHNRPAELIMRELFSAPPDRRNLLMYFFDGRIDWSQFREQWAVTARATLLDFRTEYARHADDPSFRQLIDQLSSRSDMLHTWWAEHAVQAPEPVQKLIMHATLGPLNLLQSQSRLAHQPSLRLRILVPADERTRILADAYASA
jgi:transcriptional regulator with XRE-family HTH domain